VRTNPFSDAIGFLTHGPRWTTSAYWLLLVASVLVAVINWRGDSQQRSAVHVWNWVIRLSMGIMWWSQTLWKLPPTYGGLRYWIDQIVKGAAFPAHADFVRSVVLPHFAFFAFQVYVSEVLIAVSLMLGLFTRLGALLGALSAVNLYLGLYRIPSEWPWTYGFMILLQIMLLVHRTGRSLGIDALLVRGVQGPSPRGTWSRLVTLLS
jgi:uncharacterized membrane protein YphA (DoxX/SURF4 family)